MRRRDRALDRFRAALAHHLSIIEKAWDPALRAEDPEALHDLRVAIRRTRALLANATGVVPRYVQQRFGTGFRDLGRATTAARDLDVSLLDWQTNVDRVDADLAPALGLVHAELVRRQQVALGSVRTALEAPESQQLVADWHAWLEAEPDYTPERAARSLRRVVARRLTRLRKRLERRAADPSAESRHEWRKDAKELRYLLEAFSHLYPDRPRRRALKELVLAQESLGRQRDVLVQVGLINAVAAEPHLPEDAKVAAAQLTSRLASTADDFPDPRRVIARTLKQRLRRLSR